MQINQSSRITENPKYGSETFSAKKKISIRNKLVVEPPNQYLIN